MKGTVKRYWTTDEVNERVKQKEQELKNIQFDKFIFLIKGIISTEQLLRISARLSGEISNESSSGDMYSLLSRAFAAGRSRSSFETFLKEEGIEHTK